MEHKDDLIDKDDPPNEVLESKVAVEFNKPPWHEEKMAECPDCKNKIGYLLHIQSGWAVRKMTVKEHEPAYDLKNVEFRTDDNVNEWQCPVCCHVIAVSEEYAMSFMRGEVAAVQKPGEAKDIVLLHKRENLQRAREAKKE